MCGGGTDAIVICVVERADARHVPCAARVIVARAVSQSFSSARSDTVTHVRQPNSGTAAMSAGRKPVLARGRTRSTLRLSTSSCRSAHLKRGLARGAQEDITIAPVTTGHTHNDLPARGAPTTNALLVQHTVHMYITDVPSVRPACRGNAVVGLHLREARLRGVPSRPECTGSAAARAHTSQWVPPSPRPRAAR